MRHIGNSWTTAAIPPAASRSTVRRASRKGGSGRLRVSDGDLRHSSVNPYSGCDSCVTATTIFMVVISATPEARQRSSYSMAKRVKDDCGHRILCKGQTRYSMHKCTFGREFSPNRWPRHVPLLGRKYLVPLRDEIVRRARRQRLNRQPRIR